jgi:short-subunit dehydrogenase involved in D-alanine esterification of teichoic acids
MKVSKYLGTSPIFVAGGTRGIGLEVMKQLSDLGVPVHILARYPV